MLFYRAFTMIVPVDLWDSLWLLQQFAELSNFGLLIFQNA